MQQHTTDAGVTIRTGDRFTDRRTSNRRTLRVTGIVDTGYGIEVTLAVDLVDGQSPKRPRETTMIAARLTGRDFIPVEQTGAPA